MMEHKILQQITAQESELDQSISLNKSISMTPMTENQEVYNNLPEIKKSLSTSKQVFKRQINTTDTYKVNSGFKSALKRITINSV